MLEVVRAHHRAMERELLTPARQRAPPPPSPCPTHPTNSLSRPFLDRALAVAQRGVGQGVTGIPLLPASHPVASKLASQTISPLQRLPLSTPRDGNPVLPQA